MEFASKLRWFLVIIASLLVFILVAWGLYSIARSLFNAGANNSNNSSQVASDSDEDIQFVSQASLIVEGPVVAKSEQQSYRIDVSKNVVTMTVYGSYGQNVLAQQSYTNSEAAYSAFLSSLANIGVPARFPGTTVEQDYNDKGFCSSGYRYIVELDNFIRRWSTSCSGSDQGTAGFNMSSTRNLFQRQVPDFSTILNNAGW
jgi:hypothetical protein